MQKYIEKASVLIEAMPYLNEFHGKTVVIKFGGAAMVDNKIKKSVTRDIAFMKMVGINPVIVHGGGPEINEALKLQKIEPKFVNGLRVTDPNTMKTVETVLSGKINKALVSEFQKNNVSAVGISGKDGLLIEAKKKEGEVDLGLVGDITNINTKIIESLINSDFVPVISPVGSDKEGNTFNINADIAASEIAIKLNAAKLIFLTDSNGVLFKEDDENSVISELIPDEIKLLVENGTIKGGMIPKVNYATKAVKNGVNSVHIINGKILHSLLLEIFTKDGIGTIIEEY